MEQSCIIVQLHEAVNRALAARLQQDEKIKSLEHEVKMLRDHLEKAEAKLEGQKSERKTPKL